MISENIKAVADGNISTKYGSPEGVKLALKSAISMVSENISCYVSDPAADMTRRRKITAEVLFNFFILKQGGSLRTEICRQMNGGEEFQASALSMQRYKISYEAFSRILYLFNKSIKPRNTFHGFHILACDGSDVNIPFINGEPDLIIWNGDRKPFCQIHVNALYDCLDGIYWDAEMTAPTHKKEPGALLKMASRHNYPDRSIIICDRGYASYRLMADMNEKGQKYLIRCKDIHTRTSMLKRFDFEDSELDCNVSVFLTRSSNLYNSDRKKYALLNSDIEFPQLPTWSDEEYEIRYRVVRIRLDDGSYESLVTNLTEEEIPFERMKDLYHLRWGEETSFLGLKYRIGMICFNARKREGILQEIYSALIMFNFAGAVAGCIKADKKEEAAYEVKTNFATSITNIRRFLKGTLAETDLIARLKKYLIPIRPGRSFIRNLRTKSAVPFNVRLS